MAAILLICLLPAPGTRSALSPTPSALSGNVSALDCTPRVGAYERIIEPINRSTGYITPESIYFLDLLSLQRFNRMHGDSAEANKLLFELERERQLRLEQRASEQERTALERRRDALMKHREYELWLDSGFSAVAGQAEADEQALREAKSRRDRDMIAAGEARNSQILRLDRKTPAALDALKRIEAEYATRRQAIETRYRQERSVILGFDPPTTQPHP
ncbi:MAG: hypothetical protein ACREJC_03185 [Tepidisphaeraceae bacterium]